MIVAGRRIKDRGQGLTENSVFDYPAAERVSWAQFGLGTDGLAVLHKIASSKFSASQGFPKAKKLRNSYNQPRIVLNSDPLASMSKGFLYVGQRVPR